MDDYFYFKSLLYLEKSRSLLARAEPFMETNNKIGRIRVWGDLNLVRGGYKTIMVSKQGPKKIKPAWNLILQKDVMRLEKAENLNIKSLISLGQVYIEFD